jgi:hypothetical protein
MLCHAHEGSYYQQVYEEHELKSGNIKYYKTSTYCHVPQDANIEL